MAKETETIEVKTVETPAATPGSGNILDKWSYRMVVVLLGVTLVGCVGTFVVAMLTGKTASDSLINVALTIVGVLAGILGPLVGSGKG